MAIRFPIVDAHHHLWDLRANYYPWLTDEISPRICGDYSAIRRDYTVSDFVMDQSALPVIASVHIQANADVNGSVRETAWLQALADRPNSNGFPHAIVAHARLETENVEDILEQHGDFRNVRGIRQTLHDNPELLTDANWRRGVSLLKKFGFSFDLQIRPREVEHALVVCDENPGITFVLCHTGLPLDQSEPGIQLWRKSINALAQRPNVYCKVSGFGMFNWHWVTNDIRDFVLYAIDAFTPGRCMFASNFPVDRLAGDYPRIWNAYDEITNSFSPHERAAMFGGNALRTYKIAL